MSGISNILDSLEGGIEKLLERIDTLEQQSEGLSRKLGESSALISKQADEIEKLKMGYESLRIANSLLGSEEDKRDTKLKINSLIREIDYCIAQLAD